MGEEREGAMGRRDVPGKGTDPASSCCSPCTVPQCADTVGLDPITKNLSCRSTLRLHRSLFNAASKSGNAGGLRCESLCSKRAYLESVERHQDHAEQCGGDRSEGRLDW